MRRSGWISINAAIAPMVVGLGSDPSSDHAVAASLPATT